VVKTDLPTEYGSWERALVGGEKVALAAKRRALDFGS
jgi:hypothetical protein